jgi:hypothetical protein
MILSASRREKYKCNSSPDARASIAAPKSDVAKRNAAHAARAHRAHHSQGSAFQLVMIALQKDAPADPATSRVAPENLAISGVRWVCGACANRP